MEQLSCVYPLAVYEAALTEPVTIDYKSCSVPSFSWQFYLKWNIHNIYGGWVLTELMDPANGPVPCLLSAF